MSKSYIWVYTTAKKDEKPAVVYDYQPSRSGDWKNYNSGALKQNYIVLTKNGKIDF